MGFEPVHRKRLSDVAAACKAATSILRCSKTCIFKITYNFRCPSGASHLLGDYCICIPLIFSSRPKTPAWSLESYS